MSWGVSVQGVYVLGGKCPGGNCPGGKCPGGYMFWGGCRTHLHQLGLISNLYILFGSTGHTFCGQSGRILNSP